MNHQHLWCTVLRRPVPVLKKNDGNKVCVSRAAVCCVALCALCVVCAGLKVSASSARIELHSRIERLLSLLQYTNKILFFSFSELMSYFFQLIISLTICLPVFRLCNFWAILPPPRRPPPKKSMPRHLGVTWWVLYGASFGRRWIFWQGGISPPLDVDPASKIPRQNSCIRTDATTTPALAVFLFKSGILLLTYCPSVQSDRSWDLWWEKGEIGTRNLKSTNPRRSSRLLSHIIFCLHCRIYRLKRLPSFHTNTHLVHGVLLYFHSNAVQRCTVWHLHTKCVHLENITI